MFNPTLPCTTSPTEESSPNSKCWRPEREMEKRKRRICQLESNRAAMKSAMTVSLHSFSWIWRYNSDGLHQYFKIPSCATFAGFQRWFLILLHDNCLDNISRFLDGEFCFAIGTDEDSRVMRIVTRNVHHAAVIKCLVKTGLWLLHFLLTMVFLDCRKIVNRIIILC